MRPKAKYWKSLVSGKEYPCDSYWNHGNSGIYRGFMDLPKDEYPYTIIFEEPKLPDWYSKK